MTLLKWTRKVISFKKYIKHDGPRLFLKIIYKKNLLGFLDSKLSTKNHKQPTLFGSYEDLIFLQALA